MTVSDITASIVSYIVVAYISVNRLVVDNGWAHSVAKSDRVSKNIK